MTKNNYIRCNVFLCFISNVCVLLWLSWTLDCRVEMVHVPSWLWGFETVLSPAIERKLLRRKKRNCFRLVASLYLSIRMCRVCRMMEWKFSCLVSLFCWSKTIKKVQCVLCILFSLYVYIIKWCLTVKQMPWYSRAWLQLQRKYYFVYIWFVYMCVMVHCSIIWFWDIYERRLVNSKV